MGVCLNDKPMWLSRMCGSLWPRNGFPFPVRYAGCQLCDWNLPREDGPELPGA